VSFTYWLPLTSSRTGGGPAGFAGGGEGAGVVATARDFAAATGGAFFAALGVVEVAVLAGALAEFAVAGVDAGAVAGLPGVVVVGAEVAGAAEALAVSFFAVFAGSAGAASLDSAVTDANALLALAARAGVVAVSVVAGFSDAAGFSVAGSDFFSLPGFAGASDMLMVTT